MLPVTERAKMVGLAAAAVAVTAFWGLVFMTPDASVAPAPAPVQQQAVAIDAHG